MAVLPTFSSPKEKALAKVGGPQVEPFLLAEFQDFLFAMAAQRRPGRTRTVLTHTFPGPRQSLRIGLGFSVKRRPGRTRTTPSASSPGPCQCFRIGPGLIKTNLGKKRQGDVPLEPQITGHFPFEGNRQEHGHPNERPYRKGPEAPRDGCS